ncbi:MAG: hypothetical protein VZR14_00245 [Hallerella sp.]|nr:hypothetical protein [Hallerella sp.]
MWFDPDYAEMHYKFKLPWSLLYKKEPEIILDAPFQVVPGEEAKLFIVIREANRFPVTIESLEAVFTCGTTRITKTQSIREEVHTPFRFIPIPCGKLPAGNYSVEASVTVQIDGRKKKIRRFNLTGLKQKPLQIAVLHEKPPKPSDFIVGDTHVHTYISADPVEFGASPAVLQQAAKSVGLDFVFCTDHSYDFAFSSENYMIRTDASVRYQKLRAEIAALPEYPKMIAGEEVSAGNSQGQNVHLLFPGNPFYVPGEGDCGRKWFQNQPTLSIPQIVSQTELPCFAAHPKEQMGKLERLVFRRGDWHEEDLLKNSKNPIAALEFWNGSRDKGFELGRQFWISELEKGNFILPLGGNDAHGDLNEYTGVKIPLFKLKQSHAHVFGYVRTVVQGSDPITAFRGKNLYITDGPALWWSREGEIVNFHFKSTADFGSLKTLTVFAQENRGSQKEAPIAAPLERISDFEAVAKVSLAGKNYVRAEAETSFQRFALTSACPAQKDNVRT